MTKAGTTFIQFLKKACANLQSAALSMTKYLLHGVTCNIAELLHLCGLMPSASPRATILQCRTPCHVISIYYIVKVLQTWLIETEGNIGVIICLCQGCLCSPGYALKSASSSFVFLFVVNNSLCRCIFYLLGKRGYVFSSSCLSVC